MWLNKESRLTQFGRFLAERNSGEIALMVIFGAIMLFTLGLAFGEALKAVLAVVTATP